jgi:hypothetical protein
LLKRLPQRSWLLPFVDPSPDLAELRGRSLSRIAPSSPPCATGTSYRQYAYRAWQAGKAERPLMWNASESPPADQKDAPQAGAGTGSSRAGGVEKATNLRPASLVLHVAAHRICSAPCRGQRREPGFRPGRGGRTVWTARPRRGDSTCLYVVGSGVRRR